MITLSIHKCPCGDRACKDYWVSPLWNFHQGSGCPLTEALEIAFAMARTFPDKYRYEPPYKEFPW